MKKSGLVTFGVIMSTLILCSCGEDRRCVDANGQVVADKNCREDEKDRRPSGGHTGGFYRWYYGGSGTGVGSRVSGGSYSPVSRGGFGSLGAFHGFGGS